MQGKFIIIYNNWIKGHCEFKDNDYAGIMTTYPLMTGVDNFRVDFDDGWLRLEDDI
jgi:hypothetical protein